MSSKLPHLLTSRQPLRLKYNLLLSVPMREIHAESSARPANTDTLLSTNASQNQEHNSTQRARFSPRWMNTHPLQARACTAKARFSWSMVLYIHEPAAPPLLPFVPTMVCLFRSIQLRDLPDNLVICLCGQQFRYALHVTRKAVLCFLGKAFRERG